ncbi:cytochrome c biogenesis protein [Desulfolutivibrio sulfoxidireducens]|uniref:cytochrome c biogenesis protein n=1 Tax=Desulfolutivibrio sulfoxidireducens TaxID=2773299 RepID=UPI00159DD4EF|nr:cytochrome c biogenesis protein CcsA [Desulfolutivibrio sulfoxidireducens]QLA15592.1 cytochrome C biogenesis protein CcmC [Desulfolutivibrio sulfoxidireducens]QLA19195.1 cytochrome C biogenesis protein CcmC [Desulfolutivibrio sulfoxidireducens]
MIILSLATVLAFVAAQSLIWFYAPVEATMGVVQKIFYMHMPMAGWSMVAFAVVFAASVLYLLGRDPKWDRVAGAAAEVGVLFSGLALLTGMMWARPIWNVWWTWDPRLTTTLVMWFVYAAYLVLRASDMGPGRRRLVCAVLGVAAFLDVPLVFLSARYWRSIHPAVLGAQGGGLEPEMVTTLVAGLVAFGLLFAVLLRLRATQMALAARVAARALDGSS